jgi:hypothetical protein
MPMSIQQLTLLADREFQKGLIGSTGRTGSAIGMLLLLCSAPVKLEQTPCSAAKRKRVVCRKHN